VSLEDEFSFGLELIIDGPTQALERYPSGGKPKRRNA
jgi:hypothetical protein